MEQVDQLAKSQLPLLEGRGITKTFTRGDEVILALKGVSFQIFPAEFVAITGASGSGKSTLLYILGLIDTPTQGSYRLLDQETSSMTDDQRAALRNHYIGFIFQSFHLLPRATALDNVMLPMLYAASHGSGIPKREQRQRAEECLRIVGLQDRMLHVPNQLSGGQRQRVAIARALAMRPRLLLADEPTGNLDSKTGMEIMLLLEQLRGDGVTVVMVTHEPRLASRAGRIIHFVDGVIQ